jgi:hypothetical protein
MARRKSPIENLLDILEERNKDVENIQALKQALKRETDSCVVKFLISTYAEGHLIEYPQIPAYLAKVGRTYIVLHGHTFYPLSYANRELHALVYAKARKIMKEVRSHKFTVLLRLDKNKWMWGNLLITLNENDEITFSSNINKDDLPEFYRPYSFSNYFMSDICNVVFDNCTPVAGYVDVSVCTIGNYLFYIFEKYGKNKYLISEIPL